jgi:hypothetical protein
MKTLVISGLHSSFTPVCHYEMLFNFAPRQIRLYSCFPYNHVAQMPLSSDTFTFVLCRIFLRESEVGVSVARGKSSPGDSGRDIASRLEDLRYGCDFDISYT